MMESSLLLNNNKPNKQQRKSKSSNRKLPQQHIRINEDEYQANASILAANSEGSSDSDNKTRSTERKQRRRLLKKMNASPSSRPLKEDDYDIEANTQYVLRWCSGE